MSLARKREQREARPLAQGAVACTALAAMLATVIFFAGGEAGASWCWGLQLFGALGGLFADSHVTWPVAHRPDKVAEIESSELDRDVIAEHAANHAAFSAQLASLTRQGAQS
jgi:hypothetical protein